ncbi:tagatose 1,6-diphosphate aldolase [Ignavigranum ruoffiae]|uniref:Tagatose 1,6-diphosphate aldolase n=1 Tax=Ignavigranum ruoffiae TaxID=89093 RepID=A0A1H9EZE4_9LACT|nr:tagatose-bisphosphate aldolase [Ignavigranum ruoffiae]SEQ30987.1 tagatose 1,6-diphosphate aldolase [Ignavigranum ruoffiae]
MRKVIISQAKKDHITQLSNADSVIAALAIDQRGSLKKMLAAGDTGQKDVEEIIIDFKQLVSQELTKYASSILLDPEYGLLAAKKRDKDAGLLLAYEKTGYDATEEGRLPDVLEEWSAYRLKEAGADAVKFLLYYDVDEDSTINEFKHVYMERIGQECKALDMPFFLEIVSYDATIADAKSREYAKLKPHKVIEAMKEFSKDKYQVDVLKVEVPVNMNFVQGFVEDQADQVYIREEALAYFKEQSEATHLPFIFLSAGVSMELFEQTLYFAKEAGSSFNGVLCGRATWKDAVSIYAESGPEQTTEWLQSQGRQNIETLNQAIKETAHSWEEKVEVK